ncbi:MAG: SIS domain-containing protein [Patescibacteria group bacterium]
MADILEEAFRRHSEVIAQSVEFLPDVRRAAELLFGAAKDDRQLLVCGNGGSAADAQHLAAEWVCKYKKDRRPLRAVSLTTNTSALTAIGNDYGFEEVFRRQVEALGEKDDVLVAISTSGKSPNVLRAITEARKRGMKVIFLTGARGAGLEKICDVLIAVPSDEVARIQEAHELIFHTWCEYIDALIAV